MKLHHCFTLILCLSVLVNAQKIEYQAGAAAKRSHSMYHHDTKLQEQAPGAVKTADKDARLDPANFLVVLVAGLILFYCAGRAYVPPFTDFSKLSESEIAEYEEIKKAGELELHTAILFVVVASIALVLLFYFMSAMSILITILFSLVATISFGFLIYPYIDHWTDRKFSRDVDVPLLGPVPLLVFFVAPFALLVVALWLCTKHWITNDVLAISLVVFFLANIRLSSLMVATVLLLLAFFYDIFWVFMSSSIFGKNVMVTVATDLDVPIKILIPLVLPEESQSRLEFTLIGLGDIVLPGLLLCFAWRVDRDKGNDMQKGYFAVTMAGYLVALTLCEIIVGSLHLAQPAMIYLVPGTLIPFMLLALVRKEFNEVWSGVEDTPIAPQKP